MHHDLTPGRAANSPVSLFGLICNRPMQLNFNRMFSTLCHDECVLASDYMKYAVL